MRQLFLAMQLQQQGCRWVPLLPLLLAIVTPHVLVLRPNVTAPIALIALRVSVLPAMIPTARRTSYRDDVLLFSYWTCTVDKGKTTN